MNHKLHISLGLFFLLLAGCSNDNQDLASYIQQVKHQKPRDIPTNPLLEPEPLFKFPGAMKQRNPFKPTGLQKLNPLPGKRCLEAHPLHSLKLVGVLIQGTRRWGLIAGPDRAITPVRVGDYLGNNAGRILTITIDEISLEESIKRGDGVWQKHKTTLKLHTKKWE